jgi:hypothetical protein
MEDVRLPQPLGAGVLRGGKSIRTFGAETRQRHRNHTAIHEIAEGDPQIAFVSGNP